ncbi:unnamed protein product [Oikopleura dioica]|uniref:G8 domain-containing protein n=1 Tax=Oikopleura dioica TaxID=34765 RepID=E4WQV4_OIKDI|nr:unnamed protein product [Oikopleura dioica]
MYFRNIEADHKNPNPFNEEELDTYGDLSRKEWKQIYAEIDPTFSRNSNEFFRKYKRQRFNTGRSDKRRRKKWQNSLTEDAVSRNDWKYPANSWDLTGECPDNAAGETYESWNYAFGDVTIVNRTVLVDSDVNTGVVKVAEGGKLIFKDLGEGAESITFRALALKAEGGGEIWAGSRNCRYQGRLDITLYGDEDAMEQDMGVKYLHADEGGVIELHGKEKHHWTHLENHLFANSVAVEQLEWLQDRTNDGQGAWPDIDNRAGFRMVFHILSKEGDLKDTFSVPDGETDGLSDFLNQFDDEEIILFFTDFKYTLTDNFVSTLAEKGFPQAYFDTLFLSEHSKYPPEEKMMHPMTDTIGPVSLGGEKSGFDFQFEYAASWSLNGDNDALQVNSDAFETWLLDLESYTWARQIFNSLETHVTYSGSTSGQVQKITVSDDVSSWEVGDVIVVAATGKDPHHSERFTIQDCPNCLANEILLDRTANYTHWGRIDSETGIDQRAEVGLLSRNIRFFGELEDTGCQYARTREQLDSDSPNRGNNWCDYMNDMSGEDTDRHGAHMVGTKRFANFHVSHIEIFHAGQPRLARYPMHWHHAGYVGEMGGYQDPSSAISLSIHDCFSRFVTVHGTHEAIVQNNVGHLTHGHGYFLEDGFETYNHVIGNLGIGVMPGIILPTDRHFSICSDTNDMLEGYEQVPNVACDGLSVFWIAHPHNFFHDNAAVGGNAGYWVFTHTASDKYGYEALPIDPVSGRREWRNNKASAAQWGFVFQWHVQDEGVSEEFPQSQFSMLRAGPTYAAMNEEWDNGNFDPDSDDRAIADLRPNVWTSPSANWADQYFVGFKMHHIANKNTIAGAANHLEGWQVSDCFKGYELQATRNTIGSTRSIKDSTFVGFSKNTGHQRCQQLRDDTNNPKVSVDLVAPITCSDGGADSGLGPFFPKPNSFDNWSYQWYKPEGDVYRQAISNQDNKFPAIILESSLNPTFIENNRFFNFKSSSSSDNAIYAPREDDLWKRPQFMENYILKNNTYINVDRIFPATKSDGKENNFGVADIDGSPGYVLSALASTVSTDCNLVVINDELDSSNVKWCPFSTKIGQLLIETQENNEEGAGYEIYNSKSADLFSLEATQLNRANAEVTIEPFQTYSIQTVDGSPSSRVTLRVTNTGQGDWYRISWCAPTNSTLDLQAGRIFIGDDMSQYTLTRNENAVPVTLVASFNELNSASDGEIFVYDDHIER